MVELKIRLGANGQDSNPVKILDRISKEASRKRKGKMPKVDPHSIYGQYEKRTKRAGIA